MFKHYYEINRNSSILLVADRKSAISNLLVKRKQITEIGTAITAHSDKSCNNSIH